MVSRMSKPEIIASAANPLIKDVRRAVARGTLTQTGNAVAESFHLLEEALRSGSEVMTVLASESVRSTLEKYLPRLAGARVAVLPDALLQSIAATETSQGVLALVRPPAWDLDQVFTGLPLVVVLDGLQDPGNAGAICRAAEAFGATGALFLKGSVSPFNPKTLRASAGSLFRLPFVCGLERTLARAALAEHGVDVYAAVPPRPGTGALQPEQAGLARPCALVIGSEAHGISEELRSGALDIFIPTVGVESLNAAVAAGILLYEAQRQRSRKP